MPLTRCRITGYPEKWFPKLRFRLQLFDMATTRPVARVPLSVSDSAICTNPLAREGMLLWHLDRVLDTRRRCP